MGGEGTGERLDGRSVRPFLSEVPPFQRAQGTPDRRPAGLGLRHRPAHTASPVVRQTSTKKETELPSKLKGSSHSRTDFGGRGGGRRPRVRWLQFSARAARFFGLRWKLTRGRGRRRRREREESEDGVWTASWTWTRWVSWAEPKEGWAWTRGQRA